MVYENVTCAPRTKLIPSAKFKTTTRAVNLSCELGEGQMTLKTKVDIFGFLKTFCSNKRYLQILLSTLTQTQNLYQQKQMLITI